MTKRAPFSKLPLSLILVFFATTLFFTAGKKQLLQWGADPIVLIAGNTLLFAVSIASFFLYQRAMAHPTTPGFLRNTYSGLFLKLLACIFAMFIYVMMAKDHVNKPGILACVFLYFIYTLLEMRGLMQWNKSRRNA